jgi:hypothetical protein
MMRPSIVGTIRRAASMAVLAFACACIAAQSGAPAKTRGYRIAGRVVNAITGEPVRGATLSALTEAGDKVVASAVSDADGNFSMDRLAAGKYPLTASKRGYRTSYFDEHDEFNTAIVTGEGQDTSSVIFQLAPEAVLHGVVSGDGGDAVEDAQVTLFRRRPASVASEPAEQVATTMTDDTGAYEFSNLAPGEYLMAVQAKPWFAQHPQGGQSASGAANLDVEYPLTVFDSSTDENAATPILLAAGDRQEANIALHAVPAVHLRATIPARQGRGNYQLELRQSVFGVRLFGESMSFNVQEKSIEHNFSVAPGSYTVEIGNPPRVLRVNALADVDLDPNAGTPTVTVSGTLAMTDGQAPPRGVGLMLMPMETDRDNEPGYAGGGRFEFEAVPPGNWRLAAAAAGPENGTYTVVSVSDGKGTTAGDRVTVADRPVTLTVMLSRSQTRVHGFARKDGKGFAGAMIVLIPREPAAYRALVRRDQSDSDGSFSLRDVPAGRYTVVAIEDGWKLDWRDRNVVARYLPGGVAVTVSEQAGAEVELEKAVAVQAK